MPHLLVFNRSYYPDLGATGQLLSELCEDLAAQLGWTVTVVAGVPTVTLGTNGAHHSRMPIRKERVSGVTVLRAAGTTRPKTRFSGRALNYLSYFSSASVAPLRSRRPDVVMSLTDPPILGLAALAWARRWRVPFVFLCQDIFPEAASVLEDFQSQRINRALEHVGRLLVRKASAVVAIGETMARRLIEDRGADPERVTVIHNWADGRVIRPVPKRNPYAEAHGLADRFVVLHSGNLGLSQNLDGLLHAAAQLRDLKDVVVVLQGDGARRHQLEARAEALGLDNVRFVPYVPKSQLADAFGSADVQVIGLRFGLGGVIVPSKLYGILASGRPYVAAVEKESEVAMLTSQYDSGLVVPPGDSEALTMAIRRLYEEPDLRARLAASAAAAAAHHDRPVAVGAYHDLLTRVVARSRAWRR